MIKLEKDEDIFKLILDNGENRWNTQLVREIDAVLDEVEKSQGASCSGNFLIG